MPSALRAFSSPTARSCMPRLRYRRMSSLCTQKGRSRSTGPASTALGGPATQARNQRWWGGKGCRKGEALLMLLPLLLMFLLLGFCL
jgi:hypothetical protein